MEILKVIILGVVQGIAEFLPVSSSGHIVIVESFLDIQGNSLVLNIFMHFGTLIAIVAVYWRDLIKVLLEERMLILYIAVASVPAAVAALLLKSRLEAYFENIDYVGYFLILTGLILLAGSWADKKIKEKRPAGWVNSVVIGCAQALALLPGISRSGSTISAGTAMGLDREKAARFAFLMAIPIIFGAVLKESYDLFKAESLGDVNALVILGTVVSAVVGYASLKLLLKVIKRGNLSYFSYYCFAVGVCTIVYSVVR